MKKNTALKVMAAGFIAGILAYVLYSFDRIPLWAFAAVLVLAFPMTVLALFLWWMAGKGKEDIPFIGY
jgi:membrane associated rhomboid family serine protease